VGSFGLFLVGLDVSLNLLVGSLSVEFRSFDCLAVCLNNLVGSFDSINYLVVSVEFFIVRLVLVWSFDCLVLSFDCLAVY
jgi:hypothetical protein